MARSRVVVPSVLALVVMVALAACSSPTSSTASRSAYQAWVPTGKFVSGYQSTSLASSGAPSPDVSIAGLSSAEAIVFDHSGNAWVSDSGLGTIEAYTAAQLASSGSPAATVSIGTTRYGNAMGLAFDHYGDLWAAIYGTSQVVMYTPAQLRFDGTPVAAVVLSATSGSLAYPTGLAFDASGDLWVANSPAGSSTVVEFTPSQLASTGSPTPKVTFSGSSLSRPWGLAFDANGNLWVANDYAATVVRYDVSQLLSGGSVTPAATIDSSSFATGALTTGVAFDASGALWVVDRKNDELRRFTKPGSLTGTVTPNPDVTISGLPSGDSMLLAFQPPPSGVPILTP